MRRFLGSPERRRLRNYNDEHLTHFRRKSSPGVSQTCLKSLEAPIPEFRRGSSSSLTVPYSEERSSSYPGTISVHAFKPLGWIKASAPLYSSKYSPGFNPYIKKPSNKCVIKVIRGMVLLFIIVLIISVYKLIS